MPRIIAIDYGIKRCGIAVTDELQIIATPLKTISTENIFLFLTEYSSQENIETIIVGLPYDLHCNPTDATKPTLDFIEKLQKKFPNYQIKTLDERFTSTLAQQAIIQSGKKKKERREKGNIDRIAACILLQDYLARKQ